MSFQKLANTQGEEAKSTHALVLGGSLSGMLAARVLSDHFDRVTVIERDPFQQTPEPRKGVPQAIHVHVLMKRGQIILEQLFPGLTDQLYKAGAHRLEMASEAAWLTPAGWGVRYSSDLDMLALTRPLLDWHVRRRLESLEQVAFIDNHEIVSLIPNAAGDGISGATIRSRADGCQLENQMFADLVVDATGRRSRAPQWLKELGYPQPREIVINGFLGYASRLYKNIGLKHDWKCAYIQTAPPERNRGAVLFPVEGGRWLLSVIGGGRDYPPMDEQGFLEFVRNLADPIIYETIRDLEPLSPIRGYRAAENRMRLYDRVSRFPENFIVVGDAACAFNPVYGQGMTIAAMGALTLAETLIEQKRIAADSLKGLSKRFQRRLAKVNSAPWLLATGEDFRYRETEGGSLSLMTRFMHAYMDQVVKLTTVDPEVREQLLRTFHMLQKPTSLFHPRIVSKVMKQVIPFSRKPLRKRWLKEPVGETTM
ncbi:MAG TPA: FAD-dependent monooxygenase [Pyrinomonadaceae bacterium]|nr:FAD-dependent monooxygenase [Pyrinomonadaceae bacterium]